MLPPRIFPNYNQVLYPYSPFLPPLDTQSLWRLMHLTGSEGYAPSIALAHEVLQIMDEHCEFLDSQEDWIAEKFDITSEETDLYIFGLFIPPTLLLAANLVGWIANSKIAEALTPPDDEGRFDEVRAYINKTHEVRKSVDRSRVLQPYGLSRANLRSLRL